MNERFQNALKGKPQSTPPIWFMRQAGRYHSHYQKLRKEHSFMDLCKDPILAAEVALGPIVDFDFDVSILFSDLLFPLEALGMGLKYDPSPELGFKLNSTNVHQLTPFKSAIAQLEFQRAAMQETRRVLPNNKSLIGFVGGPWTLFTYAVEGGHKGHLLQAKSQLLLYSQFCESLLPLLIANIELQFDGGAELVMLFDTAAGELSPGLFRQVVQPHILALAERFPGRLGYYSKGTTQDHISELSRLTTLAGFGVDHRWDLGRMLSQNSHGFLQGNFDQALLFLNPQEFTHQLLAFLKPFRDLSSVQRRHWICGLGHGVLPETPVENVRQFVRIVREEFC